MSAQCAARDVWWLRPLHDGAAAAVFVRVSPRRFFWDVSPCLAAHREQCSNGWGHMHIEDPRATAMRRDLPGVVSSRSTVRSGSVSTCRAGRKTVDAGYLVGSNRFHDAIEAWAKGWVAESVGHRRRLQP